MGVEVAGEGPCVPDAESKEAPAWKGLFDRMKDGLTIRDDIFSQGDGAGSGWLADAKERFEEIKEDLEQGFEEAKGRYEDFKERLEDGVGSGLLAEDVQEKIEEALDDLGLKEKAEELKQKVKSKFEEGKGKLDWLLKGLKKDSDDEDSKDYEEGLPAPAPSAEDEESENAGEEGQDEQEDEDTASKRQEKKAAKKAKKAAKQKAKRKAKKADEADSE